MRAVPRTRAYDILICLAVASAYVAAGMFGLSLATVNKSASAVWPPTGIALAAFLLLGYRVWPGIFAGAFIVNIMTAGTVATSLGIAAGNTLEGVLGCYLVRRFAGGVHAFDQPSTIFGFTALAGVVATAVSAAVGVTTLLLGGLARAADASAVLATWWLGDASGALTVTPLVLLWSVERHPSGARGRYPELTALYLTIVLTALFVFSGWSPMNQGRYPIQYVCLPALFWAGFRFGQRTCATALALLAAIAIHGTLGGHGPFANHPMNVSLLLLQGFLAVVSVTVLATAAAVVGRHRVEQSVRQLNEELERRVLERTEQLWRASEDLRRREHEQVAREQAEEANRLKDEFLATLSHELRTPLNAIVGWAALLQEGNLDPATTARAVETINRNVKIQSHLISDILDISRMTSGQLDLRFQPVSLASAVEAALDTMRPMAQTKGVTLEPSLGELTGPVAGDPERLQQVVWNLLSNAIKFAPHGGRVAMLLDQDGAFARLRVVDDGPGIDPEFLPLVFERFRQRDSTGTRRHGGLGLGLAIARHLVELHGGTISASNRADRAGALFEVRLPVASSSESRAPSSEDVSSQFVRKGREEPLRGRHILLVEDDADSRELIAMFLEGCGAEVSAVGSAAEALASFAARRPDLVVSDIAMPGKSGYDLIRELRSRPSQEGGRVPAVALTAYAAQEDVHKAKLAGFDAHLAKPVEMHDLARTLAELADAAPKEP